MKRLATCLLIATTGAFAGSSTDSLLPNPDLDSGIDGWSGRSGAEVSWESGEDVDGDPNSGSARIVQVRDDADFAGLDSACFPIVGGEYDFGGWFFIDDAQPGDYGILLTLQVFNGPDCSGAVVASPGTNNFAQADTWFLKITGGRSLPAGSASAQLRVSVFNRSPEPFEVLADGFFIIGRIFDDGFEL